MENIRNIVGEISNNKPINYLEIYYIIRYKNISI